MKKKDIVISILLSIFTCGIYLFIWFISLVDDFNKVTDSEGEQSGLVVFLLGFITCGIYPIYWYYKAGNKIDTVNRESGKITNNTGLFFAALSLFQLGIVNMSIIQEFINERIEA